jgi:hypothetical protein
MTNEEIVELQRKNKAFQETELGALFNKFVNLHATAWQLDERSSWTGHIKTAKKAWDAMEPAEKELREKLMKIAGVE